MCDLAKKRIIKELEELEDDENTNISAGPIEDNNIFKWNGTIIGPSNTPYEDGIFTLNLDFPENYPFKPPQINFKTKIFHPNISNTGSICLDILQNNWSPALTIVKTLLSISSLLTDPNPDDPLNTDAGNLYKTNLEIFNEKAKKYTDKYAN